jgi:sialate O-acetylesterase
MTYDLKVQISSVIALSVCSFLRAAHADVTLPTLFSDNMVLQRNAPVPVWGTADPGERVTVSVAGKSAATVAGPDGHWRVTLSNLPVGDHDMLTVTGKNTITLKNVAVGEVWLASGQSNMTFQMGWNTAENGPDIAASADPDLRMFSVPLTGSLTPQTDVKAPWQAADPQNVSGWSAVGYYFGHDLRKALGVPVGIIHSSYGGTPAEAWTSAEALERDPTFRQTALDEITAMQRFPADSQAFPGLMAQWLAQNGATDTGNQGDANGWAKPDFDDSGWRTVTTPTTLGMLGFKGGGAVWFRKTVTLPANAADNDFNLNMNYLNGVKPNLYFNGTEVFPFTTNPPYSTTQYQYHIPKTLIRAGQPNVIVLREHAPSPDSTLWQYAKDMGLPVTDPNALDNKWRFQAEQTYPALTPAAQKAMPTYPGAQIQYTPGALFNAMIAPLIPYAIKGCIWYQGENNAGNAQQYKALLTDLITDWRGRWGVGSFPFEIEQLANSYDVPTQPVDSGVARVREAQLQVAQTVPHTGLAVAIDIGTEDIHPPNKREVGRRLSLVALSNAYGKPVAHSGPLYAGMQVQGGTIITKFTHTDGGLVAHGGPLTQFAVAGSDKKFVWADARIVGATVVVSSPQVPQPVAVRYAWADNPQGCNLYNEAGLPASPFRTDDWPQH